MKKGFFILTLLLIVSIESNTKYIIAGNAGKK